MSRGSLERGWSKIILVASGPSFKIGEAETIETIRRAQLAGWRVIVANVTYQKLPWADAIVGSDRRFWNRYGPDVRANFAGERWTGHQACAKFHDLQCFVARTEKNGCGEFAGLEKSGKHVRLLGNTGSNQAALAWCFGMRVGLLVGYDLQLTDGEVHHHGPHISTPGAELSNPDAHNLEEWRKRFDATAPDFVATGTTIINCTIKSALTAYERMPLADAIARYRVETAHA